ncbi:sulfatase-like hydrolase/transferase [Lentisphaera profundi]|uniref:Sulfatase-like hydrolase/transferase n=1 Tax=Lentisphaera profundi TaxID=1658616 RepID=A0ABY7VS92_9BACT|nr:sulfatase-like hydrolase/transferase [Lentisphaera profundi]WDE96917.1 sulfatase-like hydrolase/transferase [Lentisphaera profundi]
MNNNLTSKNRSKIFLILGLTIGLVSQLLAQTQAPNLVFIIVDDLNDLPLGPSTRPEIATPNIDRLAKSGVSFTNAHSNDPICAPSRVSLLYGLYPQTSGLFWFENPKQRGIFKDCIDLPHHLKNNNFDVYATGKVYHGGQKAKVFKTYGVGTNYGPHPLNGEPYMGHHSSQDHLFKAMPNLSHKWEQTFGPLEEIPDWSSLPQGKKGWFLYNKPWNLNNGHDRDLLPDELSANYCKEILAKKHSKPFALFAGLVRTHTPLYAPQEYFDRFPLESIKIPTRIKNDLADCSTQLANTELYGFQRYKFLAQNGDDLLLRQWIQAYLACVSFVDDQVGEILDAIEASEYRDNTIVVFTSDHGFHMGDKKFLYKQSLWDGATHVPLIISGLKNMVQNQKCSKPVSLIDLYPTINDLLQLPLEPNAETNKIKMDGFSLRPFLMNPQSQQWPGPKVAITALPGKDHSMNKNFDGAPFPHFSVRSEDWRYTLTSNGEEELYNYSSDPRESQNLATSPEYTHIKTQLKKQLIQLRDGDNWEPVNQWQTNQSIQIDNKLISFKSKQAQEALTTLNNYHNFDLQFDYKTNSEELHLALRGEQIITTLPASQQKWNHLRLRLDQNRLEIWINNKLISDSKVKLKQAGPISFQHSKADQETQVQKMRIRRI